LPKGLQPRCSCNQPSSSGRCRCARGASPSAITELVAEPVIDPRGGVALLGRGRTILLEDAVDHGQERAQLRFDARCGPTPRRRWDVQNLAKRRPTNAELPTGGALGDSLGQDARTNLASVVHVGVRRSAL
jgi:hypothetical protein